jgi:hypothetical protein
MPTGGVLNLHTHTHTHKHTLCPGSGGRRNNNLLPISSRRRTRGVRRPRRYCTNDSLSDRWIHAEEKQSSRPPAQARAPWSGQCFSIGPQHDAESKHAQQHDRVSHRCHPLDFMLLRWHRCICSDNQLGQAEGHDNERSSIHTPRPFRRLDPGGLDCDCDGCAREHFCTVATPMKKTDSHISTVLLKS